MRFDIVTLFPAIFDGYLTQSLLNKAIQRDLVEIHRHDLRDWSNDPKHHKIDDRPFGGGPGMLIQVQPTVECVEEVERACDVPARRILLTPQGRKLDQRLAEDLATSPRLLLMCGRYEGFDQRVMDILQPEEISVGDFVLNGGEVAAMIVVDAVVRLIPGVLGDEQSSFDDSFSRGNRMLEFPQYTRPREFRGHSVPQVLLDGDHQRIAAWRADASRTRTAERRRDLLEPTPDDDPQLP
ncbi:tRNA (guanosine(37)-N1)-methyltransferase TrmD [Roseimaritima ulvae]|uniref:tRNA (guanine-N(1)-)-methyltransferase n=1 Tax=Roseimaritima ulvae TaxID=980254 RepID=A0A5B9QUT6_9BACT|nr:tRNA (guanosine(37)-N1)-methyltransferase TrmD [Roseimaritima ulvae]QEG42817.1 tRNA (guanine-N(1)-)-methyltransferase [Roseimaritima ulvae]